MRRLIGAAVAGAGMALLPLIALAEGPAQGALAQGRAVAPPHDMTAIVLVTVLVLAGFFAVLGVGYLYRRERHLDWVFQAPAAPHDDHAAH
ncbi:MAG: hypothetical protein WC273_03470 [Dehalococcoidia bacterium]